MKFTVFLIALTLAATPAAAEPFKFIRIGDKDGFGFTNTKSLKRAAGDIDDAAVADGGMADVLDRRQLDGCR